MSKQAILHIDATPDEDYILRILESYRENCDCLICDTDGNNIVVRMMNMYQSQRADLLDIAIDILKKSKKEGKFKDVVNKWKMDLETIKKK